MDYLIINFDKFLHILAGFAICLSAVFFPRHRMNSFVLLCVCFAVAMLKESFDGKGQGMVEYADLWSTIIAGWIGCCLAWMFHPDR